MDGVNDGVVTVPHSVDELNLSVRARNALVLNDILTVEQLCCTSLARLKSFRNFGKTSIRHIAFKLAEFGLGIGCGYDAWAAKVGESTGVRPVRKIDAEQAALRDGGPAFPMPDTSFFGMTLRDYLAAKSLPVAGEAIAFGLRKDGDNPHYSYEQESYADMVAESAYCIADAMLRFRKVKT